MKIKLTLAIFSLICIISCDSVMPGGLWNKFENDLQVKEQNDQGPWGGTRAHYWKSEELGHFKKEQIIAFTSKNGWTLIDSIKYKEAEIKKLITDSKPSFTVKVGPFITDISDKEIFIEQEFPRWTNSNFTLYKFKTGSLVFYPGTDSSTDENGFLLLSENGKEMTVYHLWGE